MNEGSSRSHVLVTLTMEQINHKDGTIKKSKLYLVDLAGSENLSKTGAVGSRMKEGNCINQSLSTLSRVIFALTDEKINHIPYRESKLTRILMNALGGNSKTCIIVNVSPSPIHDQETLRSIRYGTRAKKIKNNIKKNEELSNDELKKLLQTAKQEIQEHMKNNQNLKIEIEKLGK